MSAPQLAAAPPPKRATCRCPATALEPLLSARTHVYSRCRSSSATSMSPRVKHRACLPITGACGLGSSWGRICETNKRLTEAGTRISGAAGAARSGGVRVPLPAASPSADLRSR